MGVLSFLKPSTSRSSSSEAAAPATGGKKAKADLKNESTRDMLIRTGQMRAPAPAASVSPAVSKA